MLILSPFQDWTLFPKWVFGIQQKATILSRNYNKDYVFI